MALQNRTVRTCGVSQFARSPASAQARSTSPCRRCHAAAPAALTCARAPPLLQAFSLLGALGEVEDVEEVDTDVLVPEPAGEEEPAPRMPPRIQRVRRCGRCPGDALLG